MLSLYYLEPKFSIYNTNKLWDCEKLPDFHRKFRSSIIDEYDNNKKFKKIADTL